MRYLLYSLILFGATTSYSQQETTVIQTVNNGTVTQKATTGNTTVVTKQKESKLTIPQLSRPEKVKKEAVIEEQKEKTTRPTQ
jgi:predicted phosphodiesterase